MLKAGECKKSSRRKAKSKLKVSVPLKILVSSPSTLCPLNVSEFSCSSCVGMLASCRSLFSRGNIILFVQRFYLRDKSKMKSSRLKFKKEEKNMTTKLSWTKILFWLIQQMILFYFCWETLVLVFGNIEIKILQKWRKE